MSNIGKSLFNAAKAINPFEGTVNKRETNNEKLTFHGTKFALDLGSTGNFTLRKIYNSIKFAPGHAFNAVGLKSFTNYLYPGTTSRLIKENQEIHDLKKDAAATMIQALFRSNVVRNKAAKEIVSEKRKKLQSVEDSIKAKIGEVSAKEVSIAKANEKFETKRDIKENTMTLMLKEIEDLKGQKKTLEGDIETLEKEKKTLEEQIKTLEKQIK